MYGLPSAPLSAQWKPVVRTMIESTDVETVKVPVTIQAPLPSVASLLLNAAPPSETQVLPPSIEYETENVA